MAAGDRPRCEFNTFCGGRVRTRKNWTELLQVIAPLLLQHTLLFCFVSEQWPVQDPKSIHHVLMIPRAHSSSTNASNDALLPRQHESHQVKEAKCRCERMYDWNDCEVDIKRLQRPSVSTAHVFIAYCVRRLEQRMLIDCLLGLEEWCRVEDAVSHSWMAIESIEWPSDIIWWGLLEESPEHVWYHHLPCQDVVEEWMKRSSVCVSNISLEIENFDCTLIYKHCSYDYICKVSARAK